MDKQKIINTVDAYGRYCLKNSSSLQRRIKVLSEIQLAVQQAKDDLLATFEALEDKRTPLWFGYAKDGYRYFSESEDYAERNSTCMIAPLYDENDKQIWLSGGN